MIIIITTIINIIVITINTIVRYSAFLRIRVDRVQQLGFLFQVPDRPKSASKPTISRSLEAPVRKETVPVSVNIRRCLEAALLLLSLNPYKTLSNPFRPL